MEKLSTADDLRPTCDCAVCKGRLNEPGQWLRFESTGARELSELDSHDAHWVRTGRHAWKVGVWDVSVLP